MAISSAAPSGGQGNTKRAVLSPGGLLVKSRPVLDDVDLDFYQGPYGPEWVRLPPLNSLTRGRTSDR